MGKKFHIAVFCSDAAFAERRAFYIATFGEPSWEGSINEGSGGHSYHGSIWGRQTSLVFALLINTALKGSAEQLAHVGFIFDDETEFNAEIQRRGIDVQQIKVLTTGARQVFVPDENAPSVEWEFLYSKFFSS